MTYLCYKLIVTPGTYSNWEGGGPSGNANDKNCATVKSGSGTWEIAKSCTGDTLHYLCELVSGMVSIIFTIIA